MLKGEKAYARNFSKTGYGRRSPKVGRWRKSRTRRRDGVEVQERRDESLNWGSSLVGLIDPMVHKTGKNEGGGSKPCQFPRFYGEIKTLKRTITMRTENLGW